MTQKQLETNKDTEENYTGHTFQIIHIDANTTIISLLLYEEKKYDELMEKDIGGNIKIQPQLQVTI